MSRSIRPNKYPKIEFEIESKVRHSLLYIPLPFERQIQTSLRTWLCACDKGSKTWVCGQISLWGSPWFLELGSCHFSSDISTYRFKRIKSRPTCKELLDMNCSGQLLQGSIDILKRIPPHISLSISIPLHMHCCANAVKTYSLKDKE